MSFYRIEIKTTIIEESYPGGGCKETVYEYRFYSLFNGARGSWWPEKDTAVEEGEEHQSLICKVYKYDI